MKRKRKFKIRKQVEEKWTFTQWDGPPYSYSVSKWQIKKDEWF